MCIDHHSPMNRPFVSRHIHRISHGFVQCVREPAHISHTDVRVDHQMPPSRRQHVLLHCTRHERARVRRPSMTCCRSLSRRNRDLFISLLMRTRMCVFLHAMKYRQLVQHRLCLHPSSPEAPLDEHRTACRQRVRGSSSTLGVELVDVDRDDQGCFKPAEWLHLPLSTTHEDN